MAFNLSVFYSIVKSIRTELEVFTKYGKSRHSLDSNLIQKFLYCSIDYVGSHSESSADSSQEVQLTEWFSLLSEVIHLLFQYRSNWDKGISPQNLISYLNNISFKLLSVNQIPLGWQRLIWMAVLEILALSSQATSPAPGFIASVVQGGYKILRSAGQKAEVRYRLEKHVDVHMCYELYLLGAAITCLDPTRESGYGLRLAKDFLSAYLRCYRSRSHSSSQSCGPQQFLTKMVNMAVMVYTLQFQDVTWDMRLSFYVELFRLVMDDQDLREKLLACEGNLFEYDLCEDTADLPADGTRAVRQFNSTASNVHQYMHNTVHSVVQAVLSFVHQLLIISEHSQDTDWESRGRIESPSQAEPMKDIHLALASVQSLLKESPGPINTAVSDCLVVLACSVPRGKHVRAEMLVTVVRLISVSVDAFVRDILVYVSRHSQTDSARSRINALGVVTTTIISLLDGLLTRDEIADADRVSEFAEILKSVMKCLHYLLEAASNKSVVFPDLNKHIFNILKRAVSDVGVLGRRLTRLGLYSVAIQLLSPLWPITKLKGLLPSISHHEALCESYLKTSQLKEAWNVICKAVIIDVILLSDSIISTLVKILKQETQLCVVKLLEPCLDQDKCVRLLVLLGRKLALSQSLSALTNTSNILRCLAKHRALTDTERATHEVLLAQTLWFGTEIKTSVAGECLDLLRKAIKHLLADTSRLFDDILAQAAFLYWGMESSSHQTQMDSEFLMAKSAACLQVWTRWFLTTGDKVLETEGAFRLETSFRFLQRVAEQAVINYQTMTAVAALCRAHYLADLMNRSDMIQDITRTLISVIPHLGLQCCSPAGVDSQDFLIDGLKLGQTEDFLGLTAVAAHHLKTGQLSKFVLARDLAFKIIKDRGLHTCSIYTSLAILKRLDAEFHSLPVSERLSGTACSFEPTPNPLELAGESLKNIKNVVTYYLGESLMSATDSIKSHTKNVDNVVLTGSSFEVWHVIHEYLLSLKLYGDLCLHIGNAKYAKTYFHEGHVVARRCHLVTWDAIFSACHVELALTCCDTTSEAQHLLQSTLSVLKKHNLAVDTTDLKIFNGKTLMDMITSQKLADLLDIHDSGINRPLCSCCPDLDCKDDSLRQQLFAGWTEVLDSSREETMDLEENDLQRQVVFYGGTCDRCYQPEIAGLFAYLMCSQAEILWRNRESLCLVTPSLESVIFPVQHLIQLSLKKCVEDTLHDCNLYFTILLQDNKVNYKMTLDAILKLAEVKFQNLYIREQEKHDSYDNDTNIQEVQKLLDFVEREGRMMMGLGRSNVLVASALLFKSHLSYLPLLQTFVQEHEDDITSDRTVIAKDIKVAQQAIQFWDKQRCSWHAASGSAQSDLSPATNKIKIPPFVSGSAQSDLSQATNNFKTPTCVSSVVSSSESDQKTAELSSGQSGDKARVRGYSQKTRNKYRSCKTSSIEIYTDSEPVLMKKPRVVLAENNLQLNVYSTDNISIESPRIIHSVAKCNSNSLTVSGDDKIRPRKSRKVPECERNSRKIEVRTNVRRLQRPKGQLSNQEYEQNVHVLCKRESKATSNRVMRSGSHLSSYNLNIWQKSGGESTKTGGEEGTSGVMRQEVECKSRRDSQEVQGVIASGRKCAGRQECVRGICQKCEDKAPAVRRKKKEIKPDNIISPQAERRKRDVVQPPETVRGDCCQLDLCSKNTFHEQINTNYPKGLGLKSTFHGQINTSYSKDLWGCCGEDDAAEGGVVEGMFGEMSRCVYHSESVLAHDSYTVQAETCTSDVQVDGSLTSENLIIHFHSAVEIPRGRPQKKKTEAKIPDVGDSDSARTVQGRRRERTVKRSYVDVKSPELGVEDEKENIAENTYNIKEINQDMLQCNKSTFLRNKDTESVLKWSPATLSSRKTGMLQDLMSPNIPSMSDVRAKSTRQRAQRKQRVQHRNVDDTAVVDSYQRAQRKQRVQHRNVDDTADVDSYQRARRKQGVQYSDATDVDSGQREELMLEKKVLAGLMDDDESMCINAGPQTKFPTLSFCQPVTERIKYLQDALEQLGGFPHSVLWRQISQTLALCLWEKEMTEVKHTKSASCGQSEIAAYLTDSMHASFRHMMMKNLHCKFRKCSKADVEKEAMRTALSTLTFGGNVMKHFSDRLALLPADWTVGQVTIVDFDPSSPGRGQVFVTRLTSDLQPITIGLPSQRWQFLERALRVYEVAIQHKVDNLTAQEHWKYRHQQDQDMQNLVYYLQEMFLGGHKWLLRGQITCVREPSVKIFLDKAAEDTVNSVLQQHHFHVSYGSVRNLLEILLQSNEKDIVSLVECVWPAHVSRTLTHACMNIQKELEQKLFNVKRGPLVLILDNTLNKLPWESMPDLSSDIVTRVPSLAALDAMLTLQKKQTQSSFHRGVDRTNVVAVIPPDTDLKNAVSFLAPQFQQYAGWTCLIQKAPTVTELKSFLSDSSLYLYCGHNWGHQYVAGRDVQMSHGKAVAILMGCGSGKLECRRKLDGDGGPLYFLLAGCPAVVGNLWLVTDKDIDKLTSALFSHWMSQTKPISLRHLLTSARKFCRLVGLTGFAPVVYGLPVLMN